MRSALRGNKYKAVKILIQPLVIYVWIINVFVVHAVENCNS